MSDSGTIRKVSINKIFYPAAADADLSRTSAEFATEGQATTGDVNMKLTRQVQIVEGVDLVLDGTNRANLIAAIDSRVDLDLGFTLANGDFYSGSGRVSITGDVSQDAKVTCTLIPRKGKNPWTLTAV